MLQSCHNFRLFHCDLRKKMFSNLSVTGIVTSWPVVVAMAEKGRLLPFLPHSIWHLACNLILHTRHASFGWLPTWECEGWTNAPMTIVRRQTVGLGGSRGERREGWGGGWRAYWTILQVHCCHGQSCWKPILSPDVYLPMPVSAPNPATTASGVARAD